MGWTDGYLDKVRNPRKCSCGAESTAGVYDGNTRIGEFCAECLREYVYKQKET